MRDEGAAKMKTIRRHDWKLAALATAALGSVMVAAPNARGDIATSPEVFRGHDDRLNNDYDWAHGLWKGECGGDTPIMLGMSFFPDVNSDALSQAVLCGSSSIAVDYSGTSPTLWIDNGDDRRDTSWGDWAVGEAKAECGRTEVMVGLAQTTDSFTTEAARCMETTNLNPPKVCVAVGADSWFTANGTTFWEDHRLSQSGGDWSFDYAKLQCGDDSYVKGFARANDWDSPRILCCQANYKFSRLGNLPIEEDRSLPNGPN
jgi:hypothetical protein